MDPTQSPDGNTETTNPTTPVIPDAVQQRFNELTANNREMAEQLNRQNQNVQELMAANAAMAMRMAAPPVAQTPIPEGIDPAVIEYMAKRMGEQSTQQFRQLEERMTQLVGGVRASQQQTEMQQALQGADPLVAKEATRLMGEWQKAGLAGWTAKDARIYAQGQLAEQRANQQRANTPNGSGNEAITQANGIVPSPTAQTRLPPPKSDAELSKMSLTQQEAYWAGRVGDSELQY